MITLELNLKKEKKKIMLKDEMLFNALLSQNTILIKKLIKEKYPPYDINDSYFDIVNRYVEIDETGLALYAGLIVRTSIDEFVVLFLENSNPDDDYIIKIVESYVANAKDGGSKTVVINKIEIDKNLFSKVMR